METKVKTSGRGQGQLGKKRGPYKTSKSKQVVSTTTQKKGTVEVFMHSKPKANLKKSRTTVAGIIDYDKMTISLHGARNNTSLGESFKRQIGRQIALGRAKKHPLTVVSFEENKARETFNEYANIIIKKPYKISTDPVLVKQKEAEKKQQTITSSNIRFRR